MINPTLQLFSKWGYWEKHDSYQTDEDDNDQEVIVIKGYGRQSPVLFTEDDMAVPEFRPRWDNALPEMLAASHDTASEKHRQELAKLGFQLPPVLTYPFFDMQDGTELVYIPDEYHKDQMMKHNIMAAAVEEELSGQPRGRLTVAIKLAFNTPKPIYMLDVWHEGAHITYYDTDAPQNRNHMNLEQLTDHLLTKEKYAAARISGWWKG